MEHPKIGLSRTARVLVSLTLCLSAYAAPALPVAETGDILYGLREIEAIRSGSPTFPVGETSQAMDAYLDFYDLDFHETEHRWGFADSAAGRIFIQGFEPEESAGTLLFIPGYMDHSGCHGPLIEDALARGWAVYLMDLPGHGLSDGPSCDIEDFTDYGDAARAFTDAVRGAAKEPRRLIAAGHSTGCAAWIIYLSAGESPLRENAFERVIFGAPLVRSASWDWSKAGFFLGSAFLRDLPRGPHTGPELLPYPFDIDPLAPERFPVHWVKELFRWDGLNRAYGALPGPLTVVQGDKDTVVDWKYNLPYLKERFSDFDLKMVKGGTHPVFRYAGELRGTLEGVLDECLGKRKG